MGDIVTTIAVDVTGAGELSALADSANEAAAALDRLEESAGKLGDIGAAGGGADKIGASFDAAAAQVQSAIDKIMASVAKLDDLGASGAGGGGADKIAASFDEAAASVSASVDKMMESAARLDDIGAGDAAAGPGRIADAWTASAAEVSAAADEIEAAQARVTAASADGAAAVTAAQQAQAGSVKAGKAAQEDAAASAEASAKKYHLLALGGAAALAYGIDLAAKLQTGVTRLYTSAGESQANLGMISSGILGLAPQTGQSQASLLSGAYYAESAGFHGANALAVERAAGEGATAEGADLGTVSNALTTLLNDYYGGPQKNAKTQQAQATSGMNAIMAAVGSGKMTLQDLASAMPTLLPTAKSAGLSLAQVLGAESTMTAQGSSALASAQEIRHTITSLEKPTSVQAAEQQMLGINPNQLSKDLGSQGLTGTIAEVDKAIQAHTKDGMVQLDTMNQSALAMKSANEEITALPANLQASAKSYLAGTMSESQWYGLTGQSKSTLSAEDVNLLKQFATTANAAHGYSALEKQGMGNQQTVTAALNAMLGGQVGSQVALQVGGDHLKTFTDNVKTVGDAAEQSGDDIRGWGDVTKTLGFQLKSSEQALMSVATEGGQAVLPGVTDALKGLSSVAGFFAGHQDLTKDLMIGGGALALPALISKVASPVMTGLSTVGTVAEKLNIPGLDKLAGIGQGSGLSGAASGLSGAAGDLASAAGDLSAAAGKLSEGGPGGPLSPGERTAEGGAETEAETAAEGAGGAGIFTKIFGKGSAGAGLSAMAGPVMEGLVAGLIVKGLGDQLAPKGTAAGAYNQMIQQHSGTGGPMSQLNSNVFGGFEGWMTQHIGAPVGNVINRGLSQASQMVTDPFDALFGGGSHPAPHPAAQAAWAPDQIGVGGHASTMKIPAPDTSALKAAKGEVTSDMDGISQVIAAALGHPAKIPAPDLSPLKAAAPQAQAAGQSAGQGFAAGISSESGAVTVAASGLANDAAQGLRVTLISRSPSEVTKRIGKDAGAGFTEGVSSSSPTVKAAAASIGSDSVTSLVQGLEGGTSNLQNAMQAMIGQLANPDAVSTIQQTVQQLISDVPASDTGLVKWLGQQQTKLSNLANKQGALMTQISDAQQVATSQIGNASITGAYGYEPALAASGGPQAAQSLIQGLGLQAGDQKQFAAQINALKGLGLNATSLSQIAGEGAQAGLPLAQGLAQGGKSAVAQINALEAQIIKSSQSIGDVGGTAMYQAGLAVTSGLDNALKASLKQVGSEMATEANEIIKAVEKKLGTGSSSSSSTSASSSAASSAVASTVAASAGSSAAATSSLDRLASAASSAATALGRVSAALGGSGASGSGGGGSGGGGGGGVSHHTHVHVNVQGSVMSENDLMTTVQNGLLRLGANNWATGVIFPNRHN